MRRGHRNRRPWAPFALRRDAPTTNDLDRHHLDPDRNADRNDLTVDKQRTFACVTRLTDTDSHKELLPDSAKLAAAPEGGNGGRTEERVVRL